MTNDKMTLRNKLVDIALEWQENFGVAPSITSAISGVTRTGTLVHSLGSMNLSPMILSPPVIHVRAKVQKNKSKIQGFINILLLLFGYFF